MVVGAPGVASAGCTMAPDSLPMSQLCVHGTHARCSKEQECMATLQIVTVRVKLLWSSARAPGYRRASKLNVLEHIYCSNTKLQTCYLLCMFAEIGKHACYIFRYVTLSHAALSSVLLQRGCRELGNESAAACTSASCYACVEAAVTLNDVLRCCCRR